MTPPVTPLDRIMREQGRRNDWLAEQIGVSKQSITFWRNRDRRMTAEHRAKVAAVLGVHPDALLDDGQRNERKEP